VYQLLVLLRTSGKRAALYKPDIEQVLLQAFIVDEGKALCRLFHALSTRHAGSRVPSVMGSRMHGLSHHCNAE
jgi:hypothetical protein